MIVGIVTGMVGITRTGMEGPFPSGINGGMLGTTIVRVRSPLVGSRPTVVCIVENGALVPGLVSPVEGKPIMMGGMDTIPLPTVPLGRDQYVHQPCS